MLAQVSAAFEPGIDWLANGEGQPVKTRYEFAINMRNLKMNALTRWNPFREMEELQNRLGSLFEPVSRWNREETLTGQWSPRVDISETDKEYVIKAELPGLKREEVNVTYENGNLTISGTFVVLYLVFR